MFTSLSELRSQVRTVLGLPSEGGISDGQLDSYINQVYRTWLPTTLVPRELRNHFTMKTSPGVGEYGLGRDILSIVGPTYADDQKLNLWLDEESFFDYTGDRTEHTNRQPTDVLLFANQMWFHPIPDGEYTIQTTALGRPNALSDDGDEIFNPSWGLPIVYGASGMLAYDLGDYQTSQANYQMYDQALLVARREGLIRLTGVRAEPSW